MKAFVVALPLLLASPLALAETHYKMHGCDPLPGQSGILYSVVVGFYFPGDDTHNEPVYEATFRTPDAGYGRPVSFVRNVTIGHFGGPDLAPNVPVLYHGADFQIGMVYTADLPENRHSGVVNLTDIYGRKISEKVVCRGIPYGEQ